MAKPKPYTADELRTIFRMREQGATYQEVAKAINKPVDGLISKVKKLKNLGHDTAEKAIANMKESGCHVLKSHKESEPSETVVPESSKENLSRVDEENSCSLTYHGREISTVDELIESAEIDLALWEVERAEINNWEVAGKKGNGQDENGRWRPDSLWAKALKQIKVKLKRRAPKHIQDGIVDLLKEVPVWLKRFPLPKVRKLNEKADHLLEVSLNDAHFGKLCWGVETGTPYNLDIARDDYEGAIDDLLERVSSYKIEKVLFPIGSDFFQTDNWKSETANGTFVDSTDDRFQKVFSAGCDAVINSIAKFREFAQVEVIWIPGNHDRSTSWYMSELIRKVFENDKRVTVDNKPSPRKYMLYGISLIGYDHGDNIPMERLPLVMASEAADLWAKSVYRHYRIGHFHKKKKMSWVSSDTFNGVEVTILPSLSGSDSWHHAKGYISNPRTAEATIWNKYSGPAGTFPVEARSAVELRKQQHAKAK